ncbi:MAG: DUF4153 domain-containing protein [Candidatus Cryptobacteroides sp.]
MNNIKVFFQNFSGRFVSTCNRFKLPLILIVVLAIYSLAVVHAEGNIISDTFCVVSIWYLIAASLLMLSTVLWIENDGKVDKGKMAAVIFANLSLFVWALFLSLGESVEGASTIAMAATTLLIVVSVFYLAFSCRSTDLPAWNFALRLIYSIIVAAFVSAVLMGGIMLLLKSFDMLFGLFVQSKIYADVAVLCWTLIAPVLFLLLLPSKSEKYDNSIIISRFGMGVLHYLFIPLLAAYCIVLYGYAFKIIILWSLPVGWVSYLVSVLMLGTVLLIALLYPVQFSGDEKKIDMVVFRWLPFIVLPLLLLMTVGICRRVVDYGITISRLYLILFNIWCYAVCIFLIIGKSKRIWWIPVSFAVILFLASVGPQNITDITRRTLQRQVRNIMIGAGETEFPLDSGRYEALLYRLETPIAKKIDDKLEYLYYKYDKRSGIESIVDSTVYIGNHFFDDFADSVSNHYVSYNRNPGLIKIPDGYKKIYSFDDASIACVADSDSLIVKVDIVSENDTLATKEFYVSKYIMKNADNSRPLVLQSDNAKLYVEHYCLDFDGNSFISYSSMSGILLLK